MKNEKTERNKLTINVNCKSFECTISLARFDFLYVYAHMSILRKKIIKIITFLIVACKSL